MTGQRLVRTGIARLLAGLAVLLTVSGAALATQSSKPRPQPAQASWYGVAPGTYAQVAQSGDPYRFRIDGRAIAARYGNDSRAAAASPSSRERGVVAPADVDRRPVTAPVGPAYPSGDAGGWDRGEVATDVVVEGAYDPATALMQGASNRDFGAAAPATRAYDPAPVAGGSPAGIGAASGYAKRSPTSTAGETRRFEGGFLLGPGDMVDVFVWKHPDLSRQVPVRPDGRISLPLVGDLQVAGRSPAEVADEVTGLLGDYIQVPEVTVSVTQINSFMVYVLGEVATPGPLSLDRSTTVIQALATAGGLTEFADRDDIVVIRKVYGREMRIPFDYDDMVKGRGAVDFALQSGDIIYVP